MTQTMERMLPLYEAKMIHQFDHRWATYDPDGTVRDVSFVEKQDPSFVPLPRYWLREQLVKDRLGERWGSDWLLGFRNICRSTDERTTIGSRFPMAAVGHSMPLMLTRAPAELLQSLISSFVLDFVARQKVGGINMTFGYVSQFAAPHPNIEAPWLGEDAVEWITTRVRFLQSSKSWLDGLLRRLVMADLDAAWFHFFGVTRADLDYVMETFPIVKRKDEAAFGCYRTKELILEVFDAMQAAIDSGVQYSSPLDQYIGLGTKVDAGGRRA